MIYKLKGITERKVFDNFSVEVEAADPGEAQDLAYEILSDYPNSELVANRLLRVDTSSGPVASIALEFVKSDAEEIFDEGNNDDDGDGPEYA